MQRGQGSAYVKFSHPASRYAVVGVAAVVTMTNGTCMAARVSLGGLLPGPRRASAVERALIGKLASEAATNAAAQQVGADLGNDVTGDIYASAEYRSAVAPVYVTRAVGAAIARAG
jgi:carbon-monoxide dehydrogenase medium subunit